MNSYVNMGVGAFLGTVFVLMSVSIASEGVFHSEAPEKEGFAIIAEEAPAAGGAEEPAAIPIAELLAQHNDVGAGETAFKKCASCHTTETGGANKVGPNLWNIVNRPIASHEGFSYSAGMTTFSENHTVNWDYDHLNYFLEAPKKHVPGTAMGFVGLKKNDERANLIAYLRTLSDNPAPLPTVSTEGAEAKPAAEGGEAATGEAAPAGENGDAATTETPAAEDGAATTTETPAAEGENAAEPTTEQAPATGEAEETAPAAQ